MNDVMETTYIFDNAKRIKSTGVFVRNLNLVFHVTEKLLSAIEKRWKLNDLTEKIKNNELQNLFDTTTFTTPPIILHNVIMYENGDIYADNKLYRTTYHENNPCAHMNHKNNSYTHMDYLFANDVICLSGKWSETIFHFPFEFLCGLKMIKNYSNMYFHVKKNKYIMEWIELCGMNEQKIINGCCYVKKLHVPCFSSCGTPDIGDIVWLKNIVDNNITKNNMRNNIILVKRNNSRCIQNHDELKYFVKILSKNKKMNLIIHDDNDLPSLKIQLQYFHEAYLIITPHGGSEVNLLACKENTNVIEMMDIEYTNICFARIAYFLNLNYFAMETNNFSIDIFDLFHNIDKLLNKCEGGYNI